MKWTVLSLLVVVLPAVADDPPELKALLAKIPLDVVETAEEDLRGFLDARAAARVGPILLDSERHTRVLKDGRVSVNHYWGRSAMQAYPIFDGYQLLGDRKHLRLALDLCDYFVRIQEPAGFWHAGFKVNPDGTLSEPPAPSGRSCRIQDGHQYGIWRLMLHAWRVTGDQKYYEAAKRNADYLRSIQNENGSWPDWYLPGIRKGDPEPRPQGGIVLGGSYNDHATEEPMKMMIVMYHLTKDTRYINRLPALAQWIFDTQMGAGKVRGWCQQYDLENKPASARGFEMPLIEPRTFTRFVAPMLAWLYAISGEERYMTLMREAAEWLRSVEKPDPDGGWAYQYTADGQAVFSVNYQTYKYAEPDTWPVNPKTKKKTEPTYSRDNGDPREAESFLQLHREGGLAGFRASFIGKVTLSPEEYLHARINAAKYCVNNQRMKAVEKRPLRDYNPRKGWDRDENTFLGGAATFDYLRNLRIAQGKITPEQLAAGGQPHFAGSAVKVVNWFDLPWVREGEPKK